MKLPNLLICFLLFTLVYSPSAFGEEATEEPKVQEQTQQETRAEEKKSEETKTLTVSTEKNMVKKPGNLTFGVGVKRKGLLLLPVVVLKAKRPALQDRDVASEEQPKP